MSAEMKSLEHELGLFSPFSSKGAPNYHSAYLQSAGVYTLNYRLPPYSQRQDKQTYLFIFHSFEVQIT